MKTPAFAAAERAVHNVNLSELPPGALSHPARTPPNLRAIMAAWCRERETASRATPSPDNPTIARLTEGAAGNSWISELVQRERRFEYQASPGQHTFDPLGDLSGDFDHPGLATDANLPADPRDRELARRRRIGYVEFMKSYTELAELLQQARAGGFKTVNDMQAAAGARNLGLPARYYREIVEGFQGDPAQLAERIASDRQAEIVRLRGRIAGLRAEIEVARAARQNALVQSLNEELDRLVAELRSWGADDELPPPGMHRGTLRRRLEE